MEQYGTSINEIYSSSGREIPLSLTLKVIFVKTTNAIALPFLIMGGLFMFIFGANSDFSSFRLGDNSPTREGQITQARSTNASSNNQIIYEYHYSFNLPNGTSQSGISYSENSNFQEGDTVQIQYVEKDPLISRIQGMRTAMFEPWVLLIIFPFLAIGLIFIIVNTINGIKANKLLNFGKLTYGRLVSKEPTNTRINNRTVYKLTFEFKDGSQTFKAVAKSHLPEKLEDERLEKLVYDPNNPDNAVMIDSLPRAAKRYFESIN